MITSYTDAVSMMGQTPAATEIKPNFKPLYDISALDSDSDSDEFDQIDIQSMTTDEGLSDEESQYSVDTHSVDPHSPSPPQSPDSGDPDWCFLCEMSQNQREMEINPFVQRLLAFMKNSFATTDSVTFCKQTQHLYNKLLRDFIENKPHWKKRVIYEHVTKHSNENWAFKCSRYKELKEMINILSTNCIKTVNPNGDVSLNLPNVNLYLKLIKEARTWSNK